MIIKEAHNFRLRHMTENSKGKTVHMKTLFTPFHCELIVFQKKKNNNNEYLNPSF